MKEEQNRKVLQWLLPVLCMLAIVIVMFTNFFIKIKLEGANTNSGNMTAVAEKYVGKLYNDLKTVEGAGKTAASILARSSAVKKDDIEAIISSLTDNMPVYQVVYNEGDGVGIMTGNEQIDLKKCTYYSMIYQASNVRYLYVKNDGITGQNAIVIVVPLEDSTLKNLLLYYPMDRVKELIDVDLEFDSHAFAALIDVDGSIMVSGDEKSKFLSGYNMWGLIPQEYINGMTRAKVQIKNGIIGNFEAKIAEEEKTIIYAPVGINEWALVFGVNQSYIHNEEMKYWQTTSLMIYQLLILVAVFLLVLLAINIAGKKKNEENDKMLREKADTDLLTGLNNKLATERKIKEYMEENPDSLSMMFVLDIDNFKKINDTMGHAFGDEVLRSFGNQIGSVFRVSDIIGRTGGDEFTIFLKALKNDENTLREAQKLVQFFKDFTAGEYVKYSATASIGAAVFPTHGADFESLYKSADKALYKAKQRGKNQLAFYDDRDRPESEREV